MDGHRHLFPTLVFLFILFFSFAFVPSNGVNNCRMIMDQSRNLTGGGAAPYSLFRKRIAEYNISLSDSTDKLDAVDFEGVSILWLDAKYSTVAEVFTNEENDAVRAFLKSGGSLLLNLDYELYDSQQSFASEILRYFSINYRNSRGLNSPTVIEVYDPLNDPSNPFLGGRPNATFQAEGFAASIYTGSVLGDVVPGMRLRKSEAPVFEVGFWGEAFTKSKVIILADADMLDDSRYYANSELVENILQFLVKDCDSQGCKGRCKTSKSECYKDYCFCNAGFTGDACSTALNSTLCSFLDGCMTPPAASCSSLNPIRCPNGACSNSPKNCNPRRACGWPLVSCVDGTCKTPANCVSVTKQYCNQITCADGSCVSSIDKCPIVPSCTPKTVRCPGGSCVDPILNSCPASPTCTQGDTLCLDGICRPECPRYDGCHSDYGTPYLCNNYVCVANKSMCATCGGQNTTKCFDGACACTFTTAAASECAVCPVAASFLKAFPMSVLIQPDQDITFPVVDSESQYSNLLKVSVQAGTFSDIAYLDITPIALGNLRDKIGEFSTSVLSAIVDLKVSPPQSLQHPVVLQFRAFPLASDVGVNSFDVSLTFLDETRNNWTGIYSSQLSTYDFSVLEINPAAASPDSVTSAETNSVNLGSGTTHFTSFSVTLGAYGAEGGQGGDGGDGDLAVILPAVLVPVAFVVVVVVIVSAVVVTSLVALWRKYHMASLGSVNIGAGEIGESF